jgi:GSH-dependent disulfide-bond oxidoreductase
MIDLHFVPTINGHKIALMLEEAGLEYKVIPYNIAAGEHLTAEFYALNPNHKLPVIVDREPRDGGPPLTVFETGAILLYLAEKTGLFMPTDFRRREVARQWLIWQVAGLGPMHGQANHFVRYAPPGQDYAVNRYMKEARRLLSVLESRLRTVSFLADEYSIADMACWTYVSITHTIGIDLADYPSVKNWQRTIAQRPAAIRVVTNPRTATPEAVLKSDMKLTEEQWSNLFGDRQHAAPGLNSRS